MLGDKIQNLAQSQSQNIYTPDFFRLKNQNDRLRFESLLDNNRGILVFDEIQGQVEELIKCQNPDKVFGKQELTNAAMNMLAKTAREEYGVWVYYAWSNRIVHILDEDDFIEVRTNRNNYKITRNERDILSKKKIGVIGLSVGQSVAVTLAQERGCGELRIADFDLLELSNYNRIRTGIHNLNLNKAISVAREIAEIDPYFKIVPFVEGIHEKNIKDFLLRDGKLDLLIDECDGLNIKVLCRNEAKALNIPVLMEASDRGTIDVERYDLEPARPILHGFLEGLDIDKISTLKTNEERIPYLLRFAGSETLSKRAKASMVEVGQTINTWPQLASAVVFGGGLTADVSRRILLDEFHDSGRYFIDLENLIADKENKMNNRVEEKNYPDYSMNNYDWIDDFLLGCNEILILDKNIVEEIVQAGIDAPTIGNSQTWKWVYKDGVLFLIQSKSRVRALDKEGNLYKIGYGAAIENIVLKSNELGISVELAEFPIDNHPEVVCAFKFLKKQVKYSGAELVKAIKDRVTNRKITPKQFIAENILERLKDAALAVSGARLDLITSEEELEVLEKFVLKVEGQELLTMETHNDFMNDIQWSGEEAITRDGIDIELLGLSNAQKAIYLMLKDSGVISLLNTWNKGGLCEKISKGKIVNSSAIGLLSMTGKSGLEYLNGGRAFQRVWLQATMDKLSIQPLGSAISYINSSFEFNDASVNETLVKMKKDIGTMFSLDEDVTKVILFRIFIAEPPERKSLRIPMDKILFFK